MHNRHTVLTVMLFPLFVSAAVCSPGTAQSDTASPVLREGFDVGRLARIDRFFEAQVAEGAVAGGVALVLRDGRTVYERAFGYADAAAQRPMTTDAIFRIASQTKAITTVAILMLAEEGRLGLNDPVSRYIPEFARTTVSTPSDGGRDVVPAVRPITIHHLLTHTSGISYGTGADVRTDYEAIGLGPAAGRNGWYLAHRDAPVCELMARLPSVPFAAQPGDRFVYGYSTDVLGCVVERAAGVPLDRFIETRITGPLGMHDTHFFLPPAKAPRLAAVHARASDATVVPADTGASGQGHYVDGPRRSFAGGAGLVSTASDYARFLQMLLNGGELDGVRLLAPTTVELMATNQTGTLFSPAGEGFGLGFRLLLQPGAAGRVESVGTYSWGGAYGSSYLVDPVERLILVYLVQEQPGFSGLGARFPLLVYQALLQPRH
ncbi:serine hydrolase domain-containing protein [soil metagenome]